MPAFLRHPLFFFGTAGWQVIASLTPVSLYGFWTDILVFVAWCFYLGHLALGSGLAATWSRWVSALLLCTVVVGVLWSLSDLGGLFFFSEVGSTRSVPQENKVQGVWLVNQYFMPVGAYGCGQGRLITAKAPIFFPLFEYRTESDLCTHEDWGYVIEHGSWEGWDEGPAQ